MCDPTGLPTSNNNNISSISSPKGSSDTKGADLQTTSDKTAHLWTQAYASGKAAWIQASFLNAKVKLLDTSLTDLKDFVGGIKNDATQRNYIPTSIFGRLFATRPAKQFDSWLHDAEKISRMTDNRRAEESLYLLKLRAAMETSQLPNIILKAFIEADEKVENRWLRIELGSLIQKQIRQWETAQGEKPYAELFVLEYLRRKHPPKVEAYFLAFSNAKRDSYPNFFRFSNELNGGNALNEEYSAILSGQIPFSSQDTQKLLNEKGYKQLDEVFIKDISNTPQEVKINGETESYTPKGNSIALVIAVDRLHDQLQDHLRQNPTLANDQNFMALYQRVSVTRTLLYGIPFECGRKPQYNLIDGCMRINPMWTLKMLFIMEPLGLYRLALGNTGIRRLRLWRNVAAVGLCRHRLSELKQQLSQNTIDINKYRTECIKFLTHAKYSQHIGDYGIGEQRLRILFNNEMKFLKHLGIDTKEVQIQLGKATTEAAKSHALEDKQLNETIQNLTW